jgi:glutaconate CoA-transferase subunit A
MKSNALNKLTSLSDTVRLVRDGDTLALGGAILYRRPMAFVREMLRQESLPRGLTLLCFTAGIESDILVGAGLVSRVRSCYFGLEAFGLAPMFTQAAATGQVQVIEETEASLAFGIRATLAGVSFMPAQGWIGTDLPRVRPDVKLVDDPYGSGQFVAFPAIACDVAVLHALRSDPAGNAQLGRNVGIDTELCLMSDRVIVTAEEIVDSVGWPIDVTSLRVDAVVHVPRGAWPTSCYPNYALDGAEIMRYAESCPDRFEKYLASFLESNPQGRVSSLNLNRVRDDVTPGSAG